MNALYKLEQSVRGEEKTKLELANTALESRNQSANLQLDKQRSALVIAQEKTAVEARKSDDLESTGRFLEIADLGLKTCVLAKKVVFSCEKIEVFSIIE